MSLIRLGVARKIITSSKTVTYMANHVAPFARRQSTGTPAIGLTSLRALVYGVSTAGVVIGGSVIYANYNPSFRNKANEYVPGFARIANFAAKWVGVSDMVKPTPVHGVGLKKDLGSKLDSDHKNGTKKLTPSEEISKDEMPKAKESYSSDKDGIYQAMEATTAKDAPPLSTEDTATKGSTGVESSQHMKEEIRDKTFQKIAEESQPEMLTEVAIAPVDSTAPADSIEPGGSMEGALSSVKEKTTKDDVEVHSQEFRSAQRSEEHFQWLKDAAQAELLLQEVYNKFRGLDKKIYDMQKVLIQAEKNRQDKYAQAVKINTDDKAVMQTIARDISKADEAVLIAKKNVTLSQFESSEVGRELAYLLDRASYLGLKSKVEEIRQELSQLHARAMMGTVDYAEVVSGSVMKDEIENIQESELGTAVPQAAQPKAIILMLEKRVDELIQKLEKVESDHQGHIANALLKQKDMLELLAEKKLQLHLQVQKQEIWREAQKKIDEAIHEKEEELKEQLLMQATAHSQFLSDALQAQAEQLGAKMASQTEAKLLHQETLYQNELVKAMAGLRGIEAMVDTVASAGERTRQQQNLWTACNTLTGALEQADLMTDSNGHYSFMKEIVSLQDAARGDYFVLAVLDSVPQEAVDNKCGIQCEADLHQRFNKVKRICKQVSLVPETGGGLGTYALSYLRYVLTFHLWQHVGSQKYPGDMDTFELLQIADVLLEQGDMEGAITLVNYLQGEPKRVAQDWLRNAQLYLETKQAIYLVQNYMASISLSIIQ